MIKVGLDIGNSTVKGAMLSESNEIEHNVFLPSAIHRTHDEKYLTFVTDDTTFVQVLDSELAHYEDIVAVGETAMELPNYSQFDVNSTSYKANNEITTALLFGCIANTIDETSEHVEIQLAVSIPIVEAKSLHVMEDYQKVLEGDHKIRIYRKHDVQELTITIVNATVMNEGQAGFLGLLDTVDVEFQTSMQTIYNILGESDNPLSTFEDFLVVDIGEGTTDLAVFRNKRFNPEYSYSITRGYGNLLEAAMAHAERESLTIESRKVLQDTLSTENPRRQARRKRWEAFMMPEKQSFVEEIATTILKTYGRGDYFDAIIFLGGGFSALTGYRLVGDKIEQRDATMLQTTQRLLEVNNKDVGLMFGIPAPYAQTINERGLTQVLSAQ